jgi:hypothetical protein
MRALQVCEIEIVSGGFGEEEQFLEFQNLNFSYQTSGFFEVPGFCNDSPWIPNIFEDWWRDTDSFGPDGFGPFDSYVRHANGVWCMYDEDGALAGQYRETTSNNAQLVVTFTNTDGGESASITVAGTGGGATDGNSAGSSQQFFLTRI